MDITIQAKTWIADGMINFLEACGYRIISHIINPGGDGMDFIVIHTYDSKKMIKQSLKRIGFVKSQFEIV